MKLYKAKKSRIHCTCILQWFALMHDRQVEFDPPNKEGTCRGKWVSKPGCIPDMVRYDIEEQLPDEDADDGRFGADPPLVESMYAEHSAWRHGAV